METRTFQQQNLTRWNWDLDKTATSVIIKEQERRVESERLLLRPTVGTFTIQTELREFNSCTLLWVPSSASRRYCWYHISAPDDVFHLVVDAKCCFDVTGILLCSVSLFLSSDHHKSVIVFKNKILKNLILSLFKILISNYIFSNQLLFLSICIHFDKFLIQEHKFITVSWLSVATTLLK